jgi:hypothetical protein
LGNKFTLGAITLQFPLSFAAKLLSFFVVVNHLGGILRDFDKGVGLMSSHLANSTCYSSKDGIRVRGA